MARIRHIAIENFRGIKASSWLPSAGINCLIGPGDSGKSSILDAVDFCLGARRNIQFTDADFHRLDVEKPIRISVTIGELDDGLKSFDAYGMYLRGFNAQSGKIEDEPEESAETSYGKADRPERLGTVMVTGIGACRSPRADAKFSWGDRVRLAPTRLGAMADYHLAGDAVRCSTAFRRNGRTLQQHW